MKKCPYCAEEIQDDALKCKHCGSWLSGPPEDAATAGMGPAPTYRLVRPVRERMLFGVCAGVARYLGLDATLVRVVVALVTFFTVIAPGIIIYLILALIVPSEDRVPPY